MTDLWSMLSKQVELGGPSPEEWLEAFKVRDELRAASKKRAKEKREKHETDQGK